MDCFTESSGTRSGTSSETSSETRYFPDNINLHHNFFQELYNLFVVEEHLLYILVNLYSDYCVYLNHRIISSYNIYIDIICSCENICCCEIIVEVKKDFDIIKYTNNKSIVCIYDKNSYNQIVSVLIHTSFPVISKIDLIAF